jgi:hypothetical protein
MNYFGGGRNNHIFQSAKKCWSYFENKWSAIEKQARQDAMPKKRQLTLTGAPAQDQTKKPRTPGGPQGSVESMEEKVREVARQGMWRRAQGGGEPSESW